jgi:hypothetical protein
MCSADGSRLVQCCPDRHHGGTRGRFGRVSPTSLQIKKCLLLLLLLLLLLPFSGWASQIVVGLRSDNLVSWSVWERQGNSLKHFLLL